MTAVRGEARRDPAASCPSWPRLLPYHLTLPETSLPYNIEVSAQRFPDKPCLLFYGTPLTFGGFRLQMESLAGWLLESGVRPGDRVLLCLQNSPQLMLSFYAILRVNAIVVPISPMLLTAELQQCVARSGARTAIISQELRSRIEPLLGASIDRLLIVTYSDYLEASSTTNIPEALRVSRLPAQNSRATLWHEALAADLPPPSLTARPDDLCLLAFTSGTTGVPKGVMHSHRTVMSTLVATTQWFELHQDSVCLATLPFFHVTGLQLSMNGPLFAGATVVLLPRWDPRAAARMIAEHAVTHWTAVPSMLVDLLNHPELGQ
jgi:fatty-acyl-CoA synthase